MIAGFKTYIVKFLDFLGSPAESQELHTTLLLLLTSFILAWLAGIVTRRLLIPFMQKLVEKTHHVWDDYIFNSDVLRQLGHIVPGITFYLLLPHCFSASAGDLCFVATQATRIYIAVTFIMLTNAFLSNIVTYTSEHEKLKSHHLNGVIQFLKMVVYCVGAIVIIAFLFGRNPLNIIAGLGAGAAILMLVFKDSILGLVAGIQISVNRMLQAGDWITIKKLDIDGVVEEVSLTTVKIRNFDNTISTVPPYTLVSDSFQNWAPMFTKGGRRVKRALYIDVSTIHFTTPAETKKLKSEGLYHGRANEKQVVNLTLFRRYIENYLHSLPYVIDEDFVLARQLDPTPNGLPLEIWFYSNVTAFAHYESLAAETIEHFIAVLPLFGLRLYQAPAGTDLQNFSLQKK